MCICIVNIIFNLVTLNDLSREQLSRLGRSYTGRMSPLILPTRFLTAHTACSFSIYLFKNTRLSFSGKTVHVYPGLRKLTRDDPDIVKARSVAVGVATVKCCLGVFGGMV